MLPWPRSGPSLVTAQPVSMTSRAPYWDWLTARQPAVTVGDRLIHRRTEFCNDPEVEKALLRIAAGATTVLRSDSDWTITQSRDEHAIRRRIAGLENALDRLRELDRALGELFDLVVNRVFVTSHNTARGGSFPTAIGVIWANPPDGCETRDLAEFLIHELSHQLLFIDDAVLHHYTDPQAAAERGWALSAVRRGNAAAVLRPPQLGGGRRDPADPSRPTRLHAVDGTDPPAHSVAPPLERRVTSVDRGVATRRSGIIVPTRARSARRLSSRPRAHQPDMSVSSSTGRDVVRVRMHVDGFTQLFSLVDQLSRWCLVRTETAFAASWDQRFGFSEIDRSMLREYADIRSTHDTERERHVDIRHPLGARLLPEPPFGARRFAHAFVSAGELSAGSKLAGLTDQQRDRMRVVFEHFNTRQTALELPIARLRAHRTALERVANDVDLAGYLRSVARFYGVEDAVSEVAHVHLVWSPTPSRATQLAEHVLLPCPPATIDNTARRSRQLGTIVHEYGHYCLSMLDPERRQELTNLLTDRHGLINLNHPNVVDEALQTAIGNVLFVSERLADHRMEELYYLFESASTYPHAIDELARRAAAIVSGAGGIESADFDQVLDDLLDEQVVLSEFRPRHHAAVAIVFASSDINRTYFEGLFPCVQRWVVDSIREFSELSARNPTIDRWVIRTGAGAPAAGGLRRSCVRHRAGFPQAHGLDRARPRDSPSANAGQGLRLRRVRRGGAGHATTPR